ncbi:MAG: tetratricopeptide repeat protein [Betaproteobacteria bacterium]
MSRPELRLARCASCAFCVAVLVIIACPAFAHGDLHGQIVEMDRQIAAQPTNTALLLRRAELHRIHREFVAADSDFAAVLALDSKHPDALWMRARGMLEAGNPGAALPELDRYLAQNPDHATARLTRARTLAALGRYPQAAADFTLALERLPEPTPDHYLELVNAQRSAGASAAAQLASIGKGISRLGSVPSLEDLGSQIELRAKMWDAALFRIDKQSTLAARKERFQYRRGQILAQAGRREEAVAELRESLLTIDALPTAQRTQRATVQLTEQVQLELRKLGDEQEIGTTRP